MIYKYYTQESQDGFVDCLLLSYERGKPERVIISGIEDFGPNRPIPYETSGTYRVLRNKAGLIHGLEIFRKNLPGKRGRRVRVMNSRHDYMLISASRFLL